MPRTEKQSNGKGLVFAVSFLSLYFLLTGAQNVTTATISVDPSNPIEGGDVSLTPASVPAATLVCRWFRGGEAPANIIVTYAFFPSPSQNTGANYTGRETMDSTCSLHITDLAGNYSGTYRLSLESVDRTLKGEVELTVSDGPDGIHLNRHLVEVTLGLGSHLNLSCIADSNPPAQFRWLFNDTDTNVTEPTYSVGPATWADAGDYTCQAYNSRTNKTGSATIIIKLQNDLPEGSGLGPGAIAGIVIVSLALGLGLVGGLLYFFLWIGPQRKKPTSDPIQSGPRAYENVPRPGQRNIGENLGTPSDPSSHTYESLQKRTLDVYEEIKNLK